jgi:drug/metabolite transporter (DMT)-like permease
MFYFPHAYSCYASLTHPCITHSCPVAAHALVLRVLPCCIHVSSQRLIQRLMQRLIPRPLQMLKAFTPVAVLLFSSLLGLERPACLEVGIVVVICVGVAMTSLGEAAFSLLGFTFQSLAILFESSRLVLTNILLKSLKLDPLSSLYYIAPMCSLFIGVSFLVFEYDHLPWERLSDPSFLGMLAANGCVAFTLNVAVVMLISHTSALTLTLAGIFKDILLVCLSVAVFGSPVTPLQMFGYAVALLGLNLHKEYKKNPTKVAGWMKLG